ncbi:hypothetical protein DXT88_14000 [Herbaspirillum lusitanum]|nr:hypothetical protein [Herbaspirillum lusitanum]
MCTPSYFGEYCAVIYSENTQQPITGAFVKKNRPPLLTIGDLKRMLAGFDDNDELDFSGLDFYRLKIRGPNLVQVEFNQQVYRNAEGDVVVENLE